VASAIRGRVNLIALNYKLRVLAPDGSVVADLDSERACLELDMEPGLWLIQASERTSSTPDDVYEFYVIDVNAVSSAPP
jgi:hypothetical protein